VVSKRDGKVAKRNWLPASCGGHEANKVRVDERHDSHGHATIWQVLAAGATVILDIDAKIVVIGQFLRVAGCLKTSHDELVLR